MDQKILNQLLKEISFIKHSMVTKDDAKKFATKDDLEKAIKPLVTTEHFDYVIRNAVIEVTLNADANKAEKDTVKVLKQRVDRLEQKVFS